MSVELIEKRNRIARRPHKCDYCGKTIEKGEEYEWQKDLFDGAFYEWHCHLACGRVASAIWDYADPDDGMTDDLFMDTCQEVCQRFVCPDCPEWNTEYEDCNKDESYCIDKMDKFFENHILYKAGRQGRYEAWKCKEKETQ